MNSVFSFVFSVCAAAFVVAITIGIISGIAVITKWAIQELMKDEEE